MNYIGIIPARYASTRFPGKPLAAIGGKPMIQRVYEQAKKVLDYVAVATDDERIFDCVTGFGGLAVMTSPDHPCGTNRCYEAYERCRLMVNALIEKGEMQGERWHSKTDVVINIQGDEPFIQPQQIEAVMSCFADEKAEIATLVKPFKASDGIDALVNPNSPKVVVAHGDKYGRAIYFSRSVIPYMRGVEESAWLEEAAKRETPFYKHIGLYAYRADVLEKIVRLPLSPLEKAESLEQLRWLENGYEIRVAETETQTIGIDTPEDLDKANEFWHNSQQTS